MMKIKGRRLWLSTIILMISTCFTSSYAAQSFWSYIPPNLVVQVGGFDADQGTEQDIGIQGLIGDRFTVTKHHDQNALIGIGYFLNGFTNQSYSLLYGLNAFYLFQTSVKGDVVQEQMFTNLSYRYSVTHLPIYLAGRAIMNTPNDKINITVDLGVGPNFMQTDNFSEQSLDGGVTIPDQAFGTQSSTELSATVGLGIRFNHLIMDMPFEIGYRFFYLGEGGLNRQTTQIENNLKTGNIYVNALVFTLSV